MNSVRIYVLAAPLLIGCSLVATAATADTKPIVNSIGMHLLRIPAGEFIMGSEESPDSLAKAYPQLPRSRFEELQD